MMARYPTYEEYRDRPAKGVTKCNDLLKRAPNDIQLLTTKAQLLAIQDEPAKSKAVVDQMLNQKTPTVDLTDLTLIEDALFEQSQADAFPQPLTSGPEMAKLWDNAARSSTSVNHKLDVQSLRFFKAIYHNRLQDAQQALIQLKALQPKNRGFYMAHAAVTQMLSTSSDDMPARLALMLARKAVSDKYDEEKDLDVRVPGQIFALQTSQKDLDTINGKSFTESKHVHDTVRGARPAAQIEAASKPSLSDTKVGTPDWLSSEIGRFKAQFSAASSGADNRDKLCALAAEATSTYRIAVRKMDNVRYRNVCELTFVAISALVKVWQQGNNASALLQAAFLGEILLRDNQHIHEAKVILIHLYMRLGLANQAMKHWTSLSIKEIQFDTISHSFLTRLSVTHPHKFTSVNTKFNDPLTLTTHGLSMYKRCEQKLAETESSVVSHGQTGMIFDLHELRENLRLSLTKRILSLEQRTYARLYSLPLEVKEIYITPRLTAQWLETKDNRDFKAAFNYGYDVERLLHDQDDAKPWLLYKLAVDTAWCLSTKGMAPVKDPGTLLQHLDSISSDSPAGLTAEEAQLMSCARTILKILTASKDASVSPIEPFVELLDSFDIKALTSDNGSLPLTLRQHYIYIDLLRLLAAFAGYLECTDSILKKDLGNLRIGIEDHYSKVQKHAAKEQGQIKVAEFQTCLEQNADLWTEFKSFGIEAVKGFCADMAEVTKSGWSGVEKIKLP